MAHVLMGAEGIPWSMHIFSVPRYNAFFEKLLTCWLHFPRISLTPQMMCRICCMCCRSMYVHEWCIVSICTPPLFMLPRWIYNGSWKLSPIWISASAAWLPNVVWSCTHSIQTGTRFSVGFFQSACLWTTFCLIEMVIPVVLCFWCPDFALVIFLTPTPVCS